MDKTMYYMHNGISPSHSRNETTPSAATRAGLEITLLSDGSQTEKDKPHKVPLTCRTFLPFHTVHEKGKNWEQSMSSLYIVTVLI